MALPSVRFYAFSSLRSRSSARRLQAGHLHLRYPQHPGRIHLGHPR